MQEQEKPTDSFAKTLLRLLIVIIFSISLGYFEASVVVYLRELFYPNGFDFPLKVFAVDAASKRILLTEIGREAASIILIFTGALLFGHNRRQKVAYFLTIFAIWDIFYYIWLKVLLNWPASIMGWDILFFIPMTWASPVLAPVLCSIAMFLFAIIILYLDSSGKKFNTTFFDWIGFLLAGLIIIISFCIPGNHIAQNNYNSYFHWPLFAIGLFLTIGIFIKCSIKSTKINR